MTKDHELICRMIFMKEYWWKNTPLDSLRNVAKTIREAFKAGMRESRKTVKNRKN